MKRRQFLVSAGALGAAGSSLAAPAQGHFSYSAPILIDKPLARPADGKIRVAFAINPGVQVIDLAGPWETFQDAAIRAGEFAMAAGRPFELYTVSESTAPVRASGGLGIVPTYAIDKAPDPHVLVIPHFDTEGVTPIHEWIKQTASRTTLTMSICTGAYQLAKTGLLDGRMATTNAVVYNQFEKLFPRVKLQRGPRFVETDGISTAGGLTAGIDLAVRVVGRFFNEAVAQRTADFMEYTGEGWKVA
jgi:transcriptional regulator GlxA family with amidase domain